jgi:hypothetical protein
VVSSVDVLAGGLLAWSIFRTWRDGLAASAAVILYHALPVSYWVQGNANLTNAFGQATGLIAMTAAIAWSLGPRAWGQALALALLIAVGLLSHVTTFALLLVTVTALAALYRSRGGESLRRPARAVAFAALLAVVLSVGVYYGHFVEAYESAWRARTAQVGVAPPPGRPAADEPRADASVSSGADRPLAGANSSRLSGAAEGLRLSAEAVGWPVVGLGVLGLWRLGGRPRQDRLRLGVGAWGAAYALFFLFGVFASGGGVQQRYAAEFMARAVHACSPAIVVLGALGGAWAWRSGMVWRVVGVSALLLAAVGAARTWIGWLG